MFSINKTLLKVFVVVCFVTIAHAAWYDFSWLTSRFGRYEPKIETFEVTGMDGEVIKTMNKLFKCYHYIDIEQTPDGDSIVERKICEDDGFLTNTMQERISLSDPCFFEGSTRCQAIRELLLLEDRAF